MFNLQKLRPLWYGCAIIVVFSLSSSHPNALKYQLDEDGIKKVTYEETEHFAITKYFLNNYERMLKDILQ